MSTIQNLFQQAQLAEATYASFIDPSTGFIYADQEKIEAALITSGFSSDQGNPPQSAQATAFVAEWSVVSQLPDTASGFSATVFRNNNTGQFSLAIRGSTPVQGFRDFVSDANLIATDGIAVTQVVDLYNYWQSLTHTGAYGVAKHYQRYRSRIVLLGNVTKGTGVDFFLMN